MHRILFVIAIAGALAACGQQESAGPQQAPPAPTIALPDTEIAAAVAALPAPYNAGDYANGRRLFAQCRSCHLLTEAGGNRVGPNLHGMFGRPAGAVEDFAYSAALEAAGFSWDAETLDRWLADPRTFLPGNRMTYAGMKNAEDRRDLITYLQVEATR
jgi:cytochrome c